MDYIIYRKDCEKHPWVRFESGQIFLTGDRFVADLELEREKKDGEALIISLKYTPFKETGNVAYCTPYIGHKKLCSPFSYVEDEYDSTNFYKKLEENLTFMERCINMAR